VQVASNTPVSPPLALKKLTRRPTPTGTEKKEKRTTKKEKEKKAVDGRKATSLRSRTSRASLIAPWNQSDRAAPVRPIRTEIEPGRRHGPENDCAPFKNGANCRPGDLGLGHITQRTRSSILPGQDAH